MNIYPSECEQDLNVVTSFASREKTGERWRFVNDDDGHTYLIPADKREQFNTWIEEELYNVPDCEQFDQYRIGTNESFYTFTDPQED